MNVVVTIQGPSFDAGLVIDLKNGDGIVLRAAPIIGYMKGRTLAWVHEYASSRGWRCIGWPDMR